MKTKRATKTERIDVLADEIDGLGDTISTVADIANTPCTTRTRCGRTSMRCGRTSPRSSRTQKAEQERLARVILVQFQKDLAALKMAPGSDLRLPFYPRPHAQIAIPVLTAPTLDTIAQVQHAKRISRILLVLVDRVEAAGALVTFRACGIVAIMLDPDGTEPEVEPDGGRSAILRALGNTR